MKGQFLIKCDFSYSCAAADKISTDLRARAVSLRQLSYLLLLLSPVRCVTVASVALTARRWTAIQMVSRWHSISIRAGRRTALDVIDRHDSLTSHDTASLDDETSTWSGTRHSHMHDTAGERSSGFVADHPRTTVRLQH